MPKFGHPNKFRCLGWSSARSRSLACTRCSITSSRGTSAALFSGSASWPLRLLLNGRLGVTGAYTDVIENVGRRSLAFDWRGWFFVGLVVGGAAFALITGGPDFHG